MSEHSASRSVPTPLQFAPLSCIAPGDSASLFQSDSPLLMWPRCRHPQGPRQAGQRVSVLSPAPSRCFPERPELGAQAFVGWPLTFESFLVSDLRLAGATGPPETPSVKVLSNTCRSHDALDRGERSGASQAGTAAPSWQTDMWGRGPRGAPPPPRVSRRQGPGHLLPRPENVEKVIGPWSRADRSLGLWGVETCLC